MRHFSQSVAMIRRYRLFVCAICLLALAGLSPSHAYEVTTLPNGLTVVVEENHAVDLVAIDVWVRAGNGCETEKNSGVSHFVEHLIFGATAKRKAGQLDMEMESVGATLDAHTSQDWAHFNTTVGSRYVAKAFDVLHDATMNAAFDKDDVERERLVILDEIAKKQTEPFDMCSERLARMLYGTHPYSRPAEGAPEVIKTLSRDDIFAYHRSRYVPMNMAVVIVGDINGKYALDLVKQTFGQEPKKEAPPISYPPVAPPDHQITKAFRAPYKLMYVAFGFVGPRGSDSGDVCATDVLLTYFGMGYRSWMSTTLKGKMKLAEEVRADYLTHAEPGLISISAATSAANADKARSAITGEIQRITIDGITDAELATAKKSLLGQYAFENETFAGRTNAIGFYFTVSDIGFDAKYVSAVQAVTNADIMRAAGKYLDVAHCGVLTLGSSEGGDR